MIRLKLSILILVVLLVSAPFVRAQSLKVAVVDFERAVVESSEGKKASEKFNAALQAKQADMDKRQRDLEEQQKKLQTQERTLSDAAKANLQRDIDRRTTELQRLNEDAQKELQSARDEMLRPIAEFATAVLNAMSAELGYTLVVDLSSPQSNVIWFNKNNDVTAELVRRIDVQIKAAAEAAKSAAPAAAPARPATAPSTAAPRTLPAATPTPPATAPKKP